MTQWVATIKGLERNLESLNSENANNNRALGELSGDLANFAAQIASLTSQSNLLVAKE
jgi:peptidoglycan hydrolase CwlO-like protein